MQLTVLGAGTAIPATGYSPASLYVKIGGEHVLLDAGAGSLQRLQQAGKPWHRLDRIFLTHFHLDHCLDLASILFAYRLPQLGRKKPLHVYGPPGLKRLYKQLNAAFSGWLSPRGFQLTLTELQENTLRFKGYSVTTKQMDHYATRAIGYRLASRSRSLVYSGDTDYCDSIVELACNADLLVLECSVPDHQAVEGHLTPSECGEIARESGCKKLLLTHFYPVFQGYDIEKPVRRFFTGPILLAQDYLALSL